MRSELSRTLYRALLIQDISNYLAIIEDAVASVIEAYAYECVDEESVVLWIIRDAIENIWSLFDNQQQRNELPHILIRDHLNGLLSIPLDQLTMLYLRAPQLYGDNNSVQIWIQGHDLYIGYENQRIIPITCQSKVHHVYR